MIIGKKRVPAAMGIVGYIVSIPVFADSGFMLISPLDRSLSKKAGITLAGSTIALSLGLTATHTLVPPTPGPIAAAGILGADLGLVLLLGMLIAALATIVAVIFATKFASRTYIEPSPEITEAEMNARMQHAPGAFKSSLPVVVPIVLIVLKSSVGVLAGPANSTVTKLISFLGEPVIALLI